jgi:predicted nucleic acid-binding protein
MGAGVVKRTCVIAEAYLVASAESSGVNRIASFDRSIDRVGTIERIEPPTT